MATLEHKRQNFNVTPEQEAELLQLQTALDAPSMKDAILRAVRITLLLQREIKGGKRLQLADPDGNRTDILVPEFEAAASMWKYLIERPHAWKKQMFIKGRRLTGAQVWLDMRTNQMTPEETAENWDLPLAAVAEVIRYCEQHEALIQMEAAEERLYLESKGERLSSSPAAPGARIGSAGAVDTITP